MECLLYVHFSLPISKRPQGFHEGVDTLIELGKELFQRATDLEMEGGEGGGGAFSLNHRVAFQMEHLRLKEGLYSFLRGFHVS